MTKDDARQTYARIRREACQITGKSPEAFDAACSALVPENAAESPQGVGGAWIEAAHEVIADWATPAPSSPPMRDACGRCHGSGEYIVPDRKTGKPKSLGPCYRCGGKGFQTKQDERRNWGYDNFGPIPDGMRY